MRDQQFESLKDELAREIEQALEVDPSPGFQARLRERVAVSSVAAGSVWRWQLAVAGGIAALCVLLFAVGGSEPGPGRGSTIESRHAFAAGVSSAPQIKGMSSEHSLPETARLDNPGRRVSRAAAIVRSRPLPEIVISPDETAAFYRLLAVVGSPNVVFARGDELLLDPVQSQPPDPVGIAAIDIAPVEVSRKEEGEE